MQNEVKHYGQDTKEIWCMEGVEFEQYIPENEVLEDQLRVFAEEVSEDQNKEN